MSQLKKVIMYCTKYPQDPSVEVDEVTRIYCRVCNAEMSACPPEEAPVSATKGGMQLRIPPKRSGGTKMRGSIGRQGAAGIT